ncbi:hypothetical protein C3B78_04885 [Arthrobacter sp. PGP41]|nr:hypothetical protein C3B78_04885 [Arthrobacter sp. PGP41]
MGIHVPSDWIIESDFMDWYRKGDPLRAIAKATERDLEEVCLLIMAESSPSDELERSRAVRRRASATNEVLLANEEMVERLHASEIGRDDIPKVLKALGISIDIPTAAELLHIPGIPGGQTVEDIPTRRIGDKLSLLYVTGVHHEIEPDYQLALGKMSLTAVSELRGILNERLPYRRMAEILAVIEATALAIRARTITTISHEDYESGMQAVSRRLGSITNDPADPWPVPGRTLRARYGHGSWESLLNSVGMRMLSSDHRFTELDYLDVLDRSTEECMQFGNPMDIEFYDQWIIAAAAVREEHPSAVELIRRYGSWEAAVETILPSDPPEDMQPDEPSYIDCDSGWGTLEELNEWEAREFEEWRVVENLVAEAIEALPSGSFLHIQYSHTAAPYARATPGSNGVRCEIVSDLGIPSHEWRMSTHWLSSNGWSAPSPENTNWLKEGVPRTEAAAQILLAIQRGRHPVEATELRWNVGTRPS